MTFPYPFFSQTDLVSSLRLIDFPNTTNPTIKTNQKKKKKTPSRIRSYQGNKVINSFQHILLKICHHAWICSSNKNHEDWECSF